MPHNGFCHLSLPKESVFDSSTRCHSNGATRMQMGGYLFCTDGGRTRELLRYWAIKHGAFTPGSRFVLRLSLKPFKRINTDILMVSVTLLVRLSLFRNSCEGQRLVFALWPQKLVCHQQRRDEKVGPAEASGNISSVAGDLKRVFNILALPGLENNYEPNKRSPYCFFFFFPSVVKDDLFRKHG